MRVAPEAMQAHLENILSLSGGSGRVTHSCAVHGKYSQYTEFHLSQGSLSHLERSLIRETLGNTLEARIGGHAVVMVEGLYPEADEFYHYATGREGARADRSCAILDDWNTPGGTVVVPASPLTVYGIERSRKQYGADERQRHREIKSSGCIEWAVVFLVVCAIVAGLFPSR